MKAGYYFVLVAGSVMLFETATPCFKKVEATLPNHSAGDHLPEELRDQGTTRVTYYTSVSTSWTTTTTTTAP